MCSLFFEGSAARFSKNIKAYNIKLNSVTVTTLGESGAMWNARQKISPYVF